MFYSILIFTRTFIPILYDTDQSDVTYRNGEYHLVSATALSCGTWKSKKQRAETCLSRRQSYRNTHFRNGQRSIWAPQVLAL